MSVNDFLSEALELEEEIINIRRSLHKIPVCCVFLISLKY